MKIFYIFMLIALLASQGAVRAQTQLHLAEMGKREKGSKGSPDAPNEKCGFTLLMNRSKAAGFNDQQFEAQLQTLISRRQLGRTDFVGPVTIPVIFHVIFRNGQAEGAVNSPNISQAQINAQIAQLNADYANMSGSIWPQASNVQIQFCAAVIDTAGRPLVQPGIDRINGQARGWSNTNTMTQDAVINYFESTIKPSSIWDPYSYFNVWTAAMNSSNLLGYASFPQLSTLPGLDESETDSNAGVVLNWQSVGSVSSPGPSASYGFGRTLTHEAGHSLGLRHIWGDATCGNDYCNDTPPQDQETIGCPAHPAANNCAPAGNKMFQNYMDYSNDACLNTFTTDQALRCQAVMDNSPRRKELINSASCQSRPGNSILFTRSKGVISETGTSGTCPVIKTYEINLGVSVAATGSATVNFVFGGTATANADYTISPASVTYSNGDNSLKKITITIIDDKSVESPETIQIGYTISGPGVIAGPDKQTFTLTITDDDFIRSINHSSPSVTLLSENFQGSVAIPAGWTTEAYSISNPPNQWVVSTNGGSTFAGSNVAHITQNTSTNVNTYDNANSSDAYLITPLIDAANLTDITLSFKWRCVGETDFDEGYIGFIPEGMAPTAANVLFFNTTFEGQSGVQTANLALPQSMNNTRFYFVFNWLNDDSFGSSPGFTIDDIVFAGRALSVATTAGTTAAAPLNNGNTAQFIAGTIPNQQIITEIANLNQNVGCITSSVQAAGAGNTAIITSGGSGFRSNKVIRVSPAAANATASYQVTLYYSVAEMAGWLPGEIPNLKIMKLVNDAYIDNVYVPADGHVIPTTFSNQSAKGYYAYTGTVTDGFSDFMLVSSTIVLPVDLLSFKAEPQKTSIQLTWSTAQESNNKGFVIERTTDGTNYENIGWVNGHLNTTNRSDYSFTDHFVQFGITYYYRLRQKNTDNREKLSEIRQAKISHSAIDITLSPNPARDKVSLFFFGSTGPADIRLINSQGQVMKSWRQENTPGVPINLSVTGLPPGIYIFDIHVDGQKIAKKIVIE